MAAGIARVMRRKIELVGVFVNQPLDEIAGLADVLGLTHVQLHGDEGPSFCSAVAQRTGAKVIKAARIGHAADLRDLDRFHTDYHLLDTAVKGAYGGTGHTWDWSLLKQRRNKIPFLLAGGLNPDNVAEAIDAAQPWGIDVSSGVESAPGVKDHDKLRALFEAVGDGAHAPRRASPRSSCTRRARTTSRRARWPPDGGARRPPRSPPMSAIEHRFGPYGGQYVPETLVPALVELEAAWLAARDDPCYRAELDALLNDYVGRPSPLYLAQRLSDEVGHAVYLKREDLNHTGAHKINNALGQTLLAKRMGKTRIIAETGAGSHGVATATACALLGLECIVYMGTEDMRRQAPNVQRMGLLGARVAPVDAGSRTLKEAVSATIRDWVSNVVDTHYVIGSCVGPAPFPALVRDLQRIIGDEARAQILEKTGRLPDRVIACVGGGSNAIGTFVPFVDDASVQLIGAEAAGEGIETGRHGAPLTVGGRGGVLHGAYSAIMQDEDGQILEAHSISAGLDYPGTGPEHAWLRDTGRATYDGVTDAEALRRLPPPGRARGDHPGARVRARGRVGARRGPRDRHRRDGRPDLPVRPRRQGPRRSARQARPRMTGRTGTGRAALPIVQPSRRRAAARR